MNSADLSWDGFSDTYNIRYREGEPVATIILTTGDVWSDGSGYQMLIDADATAYAAGIADYSIFEYLIPENADYNDNTSNVVYNTSVSIQIPAGTYDWFITNPSPGDKVYVAGSNGNVGGRQDNYVFEGGKTYEFVPFLMSDQSGDGVDVTITDGGTAWTTVNNVTNPYTLTNLTSATGYEFQVQGNNCDGNGGTTNWSASGFFTTIDVPAIPVESITVTPDEIYPTVGATYSIVFTVLPADATISAVTFTSSDETVATVNENGVVEAVAAGTATITIAATDGSGVTGTLTVNVTNIDVEEITASDITMMSGETATINYQVLPEQATDKSVTFTSANTAIATVDADGVVTGMGVGETIITIASVQNPEVTAEITVTVTSNPNVVQFTLNVDKTVAAPGDVITVECVLNAPTEGTYTGFTGLVVGLHFNNQVFAVNGNPVKGPVADASTMASYSLPNENHETVNYSCVMTPGNPNTTTGIVFTVQFTVLTDAELGNYTFYVEPTAANNFIYNPSNSPTPIPYEYVISTVEVNVLSCYTKEITAYDGDGGYYLIASPVATTPEDANMLQNSYDLYRFNQSTEPVVNNNGQTVTNEWENYKQHQSDFNIVPGQGYLYANSQNVTLEFCGEPYTGDGVITLDYNANASSDNVKGVNLIGNPFPEAASIGNTSYYVMEHAGELTAGSGNVQPMQGIIVVATGEGQTVTFTRGTKANEQLVININQGRGLVDRAIIRFKESDALPKIQLFGNSSKLFIPQGNKDYAVVKAEAQGEMPVNFKADSNGTYTLSVNAENVEFSYLHLIDNMTGAEVDLLKTPSYSFNATTSDYTSRFKLVFAQGNNSNSDEFAFISNGNIIVNGEGMLQVIDMTGRVISTSQINGVSSLNLNAAAGVYVLQLTNGESTKTQKIVVK